MIPSSAKDSTVTATTRQVALWMAILGSFLTPFMGSAINIALPPIGREFSLHAVGMSWVALSYLLSAAMFLLPLGKLADILGRKKIYIWGLLIYTLASFLCAIATSGIMLILFRLLQGLGGSMIFGTGTAILSSVFLPGERGRVLGISVATTYVGLSVGPVVGGFLTQHLGWRFIFLINIPLGLIILALVAWKLPGEWAEASGEKFDLVGAIIYSLALVMLMYGFSQLSEWWGAGFICAAVIAFLFFIRQENRIASPVLDLTLFKHNRIFAFSTLAALIHYSATFALGFLLSLYLQYISGITPQKAGLILIAQPLTMALLSPWAGRFSDRIEARIVASAGMAMTVLGLLLLIRLNLQTSLTFILLSLVCVGLGFALFSSPNTNAVMGSVPKRFYGVASATLGTMRLTGQMLSMGITILIMSLYLGQQPITPQVHNRFLLSLHTLFLIFSCLCLVGVFASLARGNQLKPSQPNNSIDH